MRQHFHRSRTLVQAESVSGIIERRRAYTRKYRVAPGRCDRNEIKRDFRYPAPRAYTRALFLSFSPDANSPMDQLRGNKIQLSITGFRLESALSFPVGNRDYIICARAYRIY